MHNCMHMGVFSGNFKVINLAVFLKVFLKDKFSEWVSIPLFTLFTFLLLLHMESKKLLKEVVPCHGYHTTFLLLNVLIFCLCIIFKLTFALPL